MEACCHLFRVAPYGIMALYVDLRRGDLPPFPRPANRTTRTYAMSHPCLSPPQAVLP